MAPEPRVREYITHSYQVLQWSPITVHICVHKSLVTPPLLSSLPTPHGLNSGDDAKNKTKQNVIWTKNTHTDYADTLDPNAPPLRKTLVTPIRFLCFAARSNKVGKEQGEKNNSRTHCSRVVSNSERKSTKRPARSDKLTNQPQMTN